MIKTKRVPYHTPPCGCIENEWGLETTLNHIVIREQGKILFVINDSGDKEESMYTIIYEVKGGEG